MEDFVKAAEVFEYLHNRAHEARQKREAEMENNNGRNYSSSRYYGPKHY